MARNRIYHYYVEGPDDKKVIDTLKTELGIIESGKVEILNLVQKELNLNHMRTLKPGTIAVLVFDTDTDNAEILQKNIKFLSRQSVIKDVICIPQVDNLEDELVKSCSIKQVRELTKSRTNSDFKSDVLHIRNLQKRLSECGFSLSKFWNSKPRGEFQGILNDAQKIKKTN